MATYQELYKEYGDNTLREKVIVAIMIAADTIINELPSTTGHAERVTWARVALEDPEGEQRKFWAAILAANDDSTIATIQAATDAAIQNNVDAAVNTMAGVTA